MKKYRPIIATLIVTLFYTATDILIWQRIFESNQMINYADTYHTGWFVSLAGYAALGVFLLWGAWKDCIYYLTSLLVAAFSGLEDILYYLLDGKLPPHALPWLDTNPMVFDSSRLGLFASVFFWLVMLAILYFVLYGRKESRTPSMA
jgi:hypothetical protein